MIIQITLVVSKNVQAIGTMILENISQMIAKDTDDWDYLDHLDRIEFYLEIRGNCVNLRWS